MALATLHCMDSPDRAPGASGRMQRYALYFAPEPGSPLAEFGRSWFGYDAETGEAVARREDYGLESGTVETITRKPRHYGLHATIRSPFRLRDDATLETLCDRVERFASGVAPIVMAPPAIQRLGGFLALAPNSPSTEFKRLHARSLFALESVRAPLSRLEVARRNTDALTTNQQLLLAQWGYPYVLDEFRFHVTLTERLSDNDQARVAPMLSPALKDICLAPLEIRSVCLFGEPDNGRPFRLLRRFPLAAADAKL